MSFGIFPSETLSLLSRSGRLHKQTVIFADLGPLYDIPVHRNLCSLASQKLPQYSENKENEEDQSLLNDLDPSCFISAIISLGVDDYKVDASIMPSSLTFFILALTSHLAQGWRPREFNVKLFQVLLKLLCFEKSEDSKDVVTTRVLAAHDNVNIAFKFLLYFIDVMPSMRSNVYHETVSYCRVLGGELLACLSSSAHEFYNLTLDPTGSSQFSVLQAKLNIDNHFEKLASILQYTMEWSFPRWSCPSYVELCYSRTHVSLFESHFLAASSSFQSSPQIFYKGSIRSLFALDGANSLADTEEESAFLSLYMRARMLDLAALVELEFHAKEGSRWAAAFLVAAYVYTFKCLDSCDFPTTTTTYRSSSSNNDNPREYHSKSSRYASLVVQWLWVRALDGNACAQGLLSVCYKVGKGQK